MKISPKCQTWVKTRTDNPNGQSVTKRTPLQGGWGGTCRVVVKAMLLGGKSYAIGW